MNNPIQRDGEAMPDDSICNQVESLANQLAELLPQWASGQYMAIVHPKGDSRGVWFRSVSDQTSPASEIMDIEDRIATARHWNEALYMAAGSLADRAQMDAMQSVSDQVDKQLLSVNERMELIRRRLA